MTGAELGQYALVFVAATAAGAVNSVAGGGTLLSFPALMAVGQTALVANATNTAALWAGSVSSLWGYRDEVKASRKLVLPLLVLSLTGGVGGAVLLLVTPQKLFARIVPFLILAATLLFIGHESISRWIRLRTGAGGEAAHHVDSPTELRLTLPSLLLLLATAIYGGYFGAGMGIVILATLGLLGFHNIHQMNGLKNIYTLLLNGVAGVIFLAKGLVEPKWLLVTALGSIVGGYAGAGAARKIGQKNVRRLVVVIGLVLTVSLLLKH